MKLRQPSPAHTSDATRRGPSAETVPETVSDAKFSQAEANHLLSAPRLHLAPTPSRRLPRFRRAKGSWRSPITLQNRDLDFLEALAEYRLLSTPQFLRLFPQSRDAVYRRLQLLFHHGYVDRLKGDLAAPLTYSLARRGGEALVNGGRRATLPSTGQADVQRRYVAHQAMVADFRIALTQAIAARADVELMAFRREGPGLVDTVRVAGGTLPIRPDAFFGLRFSQQPDGRNRAFFLLEADRSTMTTGRFVAKLQGYSAWRADGGHSRLLGIKNFRVLTITRSSLRQRSLVTAAASNPALRGALPIFWFGSVDQRGLDGPGGIFSHVWESPDRPGEMLTLLPTAGP